ncbi:uncharacterized protein BO72DRAFT_504709 [Aspergillus fijiensis CBS 313.89]|uniref:Uncharacterized protein n=1 Tax=Aspergillus fijiensis CBS 313.89 TaxID=1448319 RepID=A0A8G1RZC8_9EURO|nr:uncharacterized protein BO72DRAFT_504709 [Aspergillus fijiensis CBS 313.89]RAK79566.1 hypothetical protein BO72DRAFT_504709 [Aspergillus fijiensis CBS 313.89]
MSTSDDDGCNTPSHTTLVSNTESVEGPLSSGIESSCPWPGCKYIIRETESKLVIALKDGGLDLYALPTKETVNYDLGLYWNCCMENEKMWLGFKNTVSAAYMGHSDRQSCWRFQATQLSHGERESFCARQHHDGGYVLLVKHGSGFLPMKAGGKAATELVVDNDRK